MGRAAQILKQQLEHLGYGDALWTPEPLATSKVEVDDVVLISLGTMAQWKANESLSK